ncbi:hypothetical protein HOO54_14500 [Bacillus sp. WMMC1349]|uniref:hypothetical protein n=1 Tax=Bacillus sp. WMMC1349 TaxID=2736254 RepID=UPI00155793AF|nr:hypothetical protein [Bacillus sp. WMMC1349]NPC93413.1 hypothetical protein [Bacillus sp. WMMC1349]
MTENIHHRKPKYIVRLDDKHFHESSEIICLGKQMAELLLCLKEVEEKLDWYVFDVFGSTEVGLSVLFPKNQSEPYSFFSATEDLINAVRQVHQFEKGVFIGIPKGHVVKWNQEFLPETEEGLFIQHCLAQIELRAFDFSYFEIYIDTDSVLTQLKTHYNIKESDFID